MANKALFKGLQDALAQVGLYKPTLVIDQTQLKHNLDVIKKTVPQEKALRLVDKSLACIPLLRYAMEALNTQKIMSFHLPVTLAILDAFPDAEILYGKPLPVKALEATIRNKPHAIGQRLLKQTTWLIDSIDRLKQYQALATHLNMQMRFVFEIDIGLRRGGFSRVAEFNEALGVSGTQALLSCRGLMGYEAHAAELPMIFGGMAEQLEKANQRLERYVSYLPHNCREIINTGGSKTFLAYQNFNTANELSFGSALLKPTDFDLCQLNTLQPAMYIATPILKVCDAKLPGPRWLTCAMQKLRKLPKKGCFIYGGQWLAEPVYPEGLSFNAVWGASSNQQFMGLPNQHNVQTDDFAFFRPTQSESILQHFGPIAIVEDNHVVDFWSPLPTE